MNSAMLTFFLVMLGAAFGDLLPPEKSYKILMLLPVGTKSHKVFLTAVADILADRGHKVTMLSGFPASSKHPNVLEISHGLKDLSFDDMNFFEAHDDRTGGFSILGELLPPMTRKIYKLPQVKDLYAKRKTFDLIIVDNMINEMIYPFVHELTYMSVSAFGMDPRHSAVLGNVQNPAYVSGLLDEYPNPMGIWHRLLNLVQHIWMPFYWATWAVVPEIQAEISAIFPDLPPLLEIERNQSLSLLNSHFSMDTTLPLLPSQVEVGAVHCRPAQLLPKDLESFISGAGPEGVIYFSLGTVAQGNTMPVKFRNMFIEAFKRLKQRVVWKYEEPLDGVPDNVLIRKWCPQQDILGHPKVKAFLSHGGLLSTQESLYHATPVVALPIFADQPKNAMKIERLGLGIMLLWEELTVDLIVDSLQEVMSNPKYKQNAQDVSSALWDQPQSPRERAVFWTEYVIRHKGAPHLRSPAAEMSWVEFLMLDVLLVLHILMFVAFKILCRVFNFLAGKNSPSKISGKKKKE